MQERLRSYSPKRKDAVLHLLLKRKIYLNWLSVNKNLFFMIAIKFRSFFEFIWIKFKRECFFWKNKQMILVRTI